jgi:hypothetical protein
MKSMNSKERKRYREAFKTRSQYYKTLLKEVEKEIEKEK